MSGVVGVYFTFDRPLFILSFCHSVLLLRLRIRTSTVVSTVLPLSKDSTHWRLIVVPVEAMFFVHEAATKYRLREGIVVVRVVLCHLLTRTVSY